MSRTVYIVTVGEDGDFNLVAAFTAKAAAQKYAKRGGYEVVALELNKAPRIPKPTKPSTGGPRTPMERLLAKATTKYVEGAAAEAKVAKSKWQYLKKCGRISTGPGGALMWNVAWTPPAQTPRPKRRTGRRTRRASSR